MSVANIHKSDMDPITADFYSAQNAIDSRVEATMIRLQNQAYERGVARMREEAGDLVDSAQAGARAQEVTA